MNAPEPFQPGVYQMRSGKVAVVTGVAPESIGLTHPLSGFIQTLEGWGHFQWKRNGRELNYRDSGNDLVVKISDNIDFDWPKKTKRPWTEEEVLELLKTRGQLQIRPLGCDTTYIIKWVGQDKIFTLGRMELTLEELFRHFIQTNGAICGVEE